MARALPINAPKSEIDWGGDGYKDASDIAKKMLAERKLINSKSKLTWNRENEDKMFPTDYMVGEVNMSAPYMRIGTGKPGKYYYIQNCELYLGNGVRTTIEEIMDIESREPLGAEVVKALIEAEKRFLEDAASRDQALCKHCRHFRAKDNEEYLKHVLMEHPDHALKVSGVSEAIPEKVEVKTPLIVNGTECCGKVFKNSTALAAHRRFSKTEHGA